MGYGLRTPDIISTGSVSRKREGGVTSPPSGKYDGRTKRAAGSAGDVSQSLFIVSLTSPRNSPEPRAPRRHPQ